ncbi:hypothetical protein RCH09_000295 [Actimicrobium sp. GrIS 1.19]|uniref:hypothetical protein n=1 Tax=Actimicrobium sp. GrIS 1.19 TaxID=3071708 RepID=UPI002E04C628|nr:hypothetical protein [Actimicrobium sp. GrIS 1.19]
MLVIVVGNSFSENRPATETDPVVHPAVSFMPYFDRKGFSVAKMRRPIVFARRGARDVMRYR